MNYFFKVLICVILLGGVITGFITFVDPYDLYSWEFYRLKGWIGSTATRNRKYFLMKKGDIRFLVLGSSRAQYFELPEETEGFFNGYAEYTRIPEILSILNHCVEHNPVEKVVIQLDFYMFNHSEILPKTYLKSKFYTSKKETNYWGNVLPYTSVQSLKDTFEVVFGRMFGRPEERIDRNGINRKWRYNWIRQRNIQVFRPIFQRDYKNFEVFELYLEDLRTIKRICEKRKIQLKIMLSPVNYEHWNLIQNDLILSARTRKVKQVIKDIFGNYVDFFHEKVKDFEGKKFWMDSVHTTPEFSRFLIQEGISENSHRKLGILR